MLPENFSYPTAKQCTYLNAWRPLPEIPHVDYFYSGGFMRFSHLGENYLAGFTPHGLAVGFLQTPRPDSQADIYLLRTGQHGALNAFPTHSTPPGQLAAHFASQFSPPPSGNLHFSPGYKFLSVGK